MPVTKFNLEKKTISNKFYRKVIYTDKNIQLVFMSLEPSEFIPREKHKNITQFIRVEEGKIISKIGNKVYHLEDGDMIIIPPNTWHEITQIGNKPVKLYSIYSPPEHSPNKINWNQPLND